MRLGPEGFGTCCINYKKKKNVGTYKRTFFTGANVLTGPQVTVDVGFRVVPSIADLIAVHGGQADHVHQVFVEVPPKTGQRGAQSNGEQALLSGYRYDETDGFTWNGEFDYRLAECANGDGVIDIFSRVGPPWWQARQESQRSTPIPLIVEKKKNALFLWKAGTPGPTTEPTLWGGYTAVGALETICSDARCT